MARIETTSNNKDFDNKSLRQEIKQEVKKEFFRSEIKGKFRKFFRKIGCLLFVLLILFGLVTVGAAALAKTGLWEIPIISKIFYQQPKPSRAVPGNKSVVEITTDLGWRAAKQALSSQSPELVIPVTEEELTVLARKSFASSSLLRSRLNVDTLQLVANPGEVEFFSQLFWPRQTYLTVGFLPSVEENKIKIILTRWHLGGLKMPLSLGNWFLNKFLSGRFDQLLTPVLQKVELKEIRTGQGEITIVGSLK